MGKAVQPGSLRHAAAMLLVAALLLSAGAGSANEGVFTLGYDTLQLQRGASGVASPRSAAWIYMNPAAIVDLDKRLDLNLYTVFTDVTIEPGGIIGNRIDADLQSERPYEIPSGGMILPTDKGTFGFGLYVPSGSGVDFKHSRNLIARLFLGDTDRRLSYQHIRVIGAYAYEFESGWAIGFALHGSLSRIKTDHLTLRLQPTQGDYEWDSALGAGFGLGVYKNWEKWGIGLGIISRHWVQEFDKYSDLLDHPVDLPTIVQAGVAWRPKPKIELTLDYKWLDWSDVRNFGTAVRNSSFDWDDQHGIKLGLEWKARPQWTWRLGYSYANTPIDQDHVFVAALVPVTVEEHLTAGFTYHASEHHEFHFTILQAFRHEVVDTGHGDIFSWLNAGTRIESGGSSFSVGYSYLF